MTNSQFVVKGLNYPEINEVEVRQIEIKCLICGNVFIKQMTNGETLSWHEKDCSIRLKGEYLECGFCLSKVLEFNKGCYD